MNNIGSTWNKWNLHIHTPDTAKNDNFNGDWDTYIEKLEESDVKVLGITDYYLIENFKKVKDYKDTGRLKNIELLVINLEMRLIHSTEKDKGVNFHILFSDEIYDKIESHFLSKLQYKYKKHSYRAIKEDFIELGKEFTKNQNLSNEKALEIGIEQFKVSIDEIERVLEESKRYFEGKYLMGVANASKDGLSGIRDNQMKSMRQEILSSCDFIFSGNSKDINFYSGQTNLKAIQRDAGKLLPCIHGCDAHDIEKVCNPDMDRHTWIKAELSFDGLKQIVHEPINRVRVQKNSPDDKKDYEVIESIEFDDTQGMFGKQTINLTSGLNTIIGGKSSGKSLLLYKIAQSINPDFINKISEEQLWKNNYQDTVIDELPTTITWRDKQVSSKENPTGSITYIPQMYINELAESEDSHILQNKLEKFISEEPQIKDSLLRLKEMKTEYINYNNQLIQTIEDKNESRKDYEVSITEIGTYKSLSTELEKIKEKIGENIQESNIGQDQIDKYDSLKETINKKLKKISLINKESTKFKDKLDDIDSKFKYFISDIAIHTFDGDLNKKFEILKEDMNATVTAFTQEVTNNISANNTKVDEYNNSIEEIKKQVEPLNELMKKRTEIEKLEEQKEIEEGKIKKIIDYQEKIKEIDNQIEVAIENIKSNTEEYYLLLKEVVEKINNQNITFNDITIVSTYKTEDIIYKKFLEKINQRTFSPKEISISQKDNHDLSFENQDIEIFIDNLKKDIHKILSTERRKLRKGESRYSILKKFLEPLLDFHLSLKDKNEVISKMSPGKSGLVILKLLINTLNDNHPILLDQPEDNLDNRTISTDLVKTIREISEQRQVIMVTHNANLVVLTDSENVIVANQDRAKEENLEYDFEYRNGPLESNIFEKDKGLLMEKGIKTHIFDILEGGERAFSIRERRYEVSYEK